MSGFEIVGVVLAVLPLFISALEHYEDGAKPIASLFRYQHQISGYREDLMIQHAIFKQTIVNLLTEASIGTDSERAEMEKDPRCDLWKSGHLADQLDVYLAGVQNAYAATIKNIHRNVFSIAKELDVQDMGELNQTEFEALLDGHRQIVPSTLAQKAALLMTKHELKKRIKYVVKSGRVRSPWSS